MKVLLDYDGALADSHAVVCKLIEYREGIQVSPKDIDSWDYWKKRGLDDAFWGAYNLLDTTNLRLGIPPLDGYVAKAVRRLVANYDRVDLVTANRTEAEDSIRNWARYHLGVAALRINVVCLGRTGTSKATLGYDLIIDDSPSLAKSILESYPETRLLLPDQPWNRDVPDGPNVRRFHSWAHVPRLAAELLGQGRLDTFTGAAEA